LLVAEISRVHTRCEGLNWREEQVSVMRSSSQLAGRQSKITQEVLCYMHLPMPHKNTRKMVLSKNDNLKTR
jgi:hypothetical protein